MGSGGAALEGDKLNFTCSNTHTHTAPPPCPSAHALPRAAMDRKTRKVVDKTTGQLVTAEEASTNATAATNKAKSNDPNLPRGINWEVAQARYVYSRKSKKVYLAREVFTVAHYKEKELALEAALKFKAEFEAKLGL